MVALLGRTHLPGSRLSLHPAIRTGTSGVLLTNTTFGWPLLIGGSLKVVYDLTLLKMFQDVTPHEEQ